MRGLCGWVARNSHAIHVTMAGLLIVVLSVAMVLFGIGLVALVAQVCLRVCCFISLLMALLAAAGPRMHMAAACCQKREQRWQHCCCSQSLARHAQPLLP